MINVQIHNDLLAMEYDRRGKSHHRAEGNGRGESVYRSTNIIKVLKYYCQETAGEARHVCFKEDGKKMQVVR